MHGTGRRRAEVTGCELTITHSLTQNTHVHILTHSLSLSLSHTLTHTHTLSLSLSLTTHTHYPPIIAKHMHTLGVRKREMVGPLMN
jgi:hypothetical protein